MSTNIDAPSDADKWFDETGRYYLANGHLESALKAAFNDGLAASKPEPQAQAGEPEKFNTPNLDAIGLVAPTPREYAAALCKRWDEKWQKKMDEAIAKRDAALKACVEAGEQAKRWIAQQMLDNGWSQDRIDNPPTGSHLFNLRAAIAKAQEALK